MDKRFDDLGAQIGALQTIVENLQAPVAAAQAPVAPPPRDGRVGERALQVQPPPRVDNHVGDDHLAAGYVLSRSELGHPGRLVLPVLQIR